MSIIRFGDCITLMQQFSAEGHKAQMCVTSPPYFGLRDYGITGQIGLENTPEEYVNRIVEVCRGIRNLLKDDGTLWLNLGDSYVGATSQHKEGGSAGHNSCINKKTMSGIPQNGRGARNRALYKSGLKIKNLIGIPWRVALALQADGWILRQDIVWHKNNPMPSSVKDRCTSAHEYLFLLAKNPRYYFDSQAIQEPAVSDHKSGNGFVRPERLSYRNPDGTARGNSKQWTDIGGMRNRRSVWTVGIKPYKGAHFACFPPELIRPCIRAGSRPGDVILDPFMGSGTTAQVALEEGREYLGCELNPEYEKLQQERIIIALEQQ